MATPGLEPRKGQPAEGTPGWTPTHSQGACWLQLRADEGAGVRAGFSPGLPGPSPGCGCGGSKEAAPCEGNPVGPAAQICRPWPSGGRERRKDRPLWSGAGSLARQHAPRPPPREGQAWAPWPRARDRRSSLVGLALAQARAPAGFTQLMALDPLGFNPAKPRSRAPEPPPRTKGTVWGGARPPKVPPSQRPAPTAAHGRLSLQAPVGRLPPRPPGPQHGHIRSHPRQPSLAPAGGTMGSRRCPGPASLSLPVSSPRPCPCPCPVPAVSSPLPCRVLAP